MLKDLIIGQSKIFGAEWTSTKVYNTALKESKKAKESPVMYPVLNIMPIKQHRPADCILVCVLQILRFYGVTIQHEEGIIKEYGDRYSDEAGSSYSDAIKFLKHYGFEASYIDHTPESLLEAKNKGHPVIFDVIYSKKWHHAIVFAGADKSWFYFSDPVIGKWIKIPSRFMTLMMQDSTAAIEVYPKKLFK